MDNGKAPLTADATLVRWHDPRVETPPLGTPLMVMTKGGIAQKGTWSPEFLAYHELIKAPPWLKLRIQEAYKKPEPIIVHKETL